MTICIFLALQEFEDGRVMFRRFAFDGETENNSQFIGQGSSPEDACSDYWYQAHGDVAELWYDEESEQWYLYQGSYRVSFDTKAEAVDYANRHEWQIKDWRNAI